MATVIDSLVISLGLDVNNLKKDQKSAKESLDKFSKDSEKSTKNLKNETISLGKEFSKVRNELLAFGAAALSVRSVAGFLNEKISSLSNIGRVASDFNMSAKELDAWGKAAASAGGNSEGLKASFQSILSGFEALKLGDASNPIVQALTALNVSAYDNNGNQRPLADIILDISDALKKLPRQDQIKIQSMVGMDRGTFDLLRDTNINLREMVEHYLALSNVTDENIAAAQKAQKVFAELNASFSALGDTIFTNAVGPMEDLLKSLNKISDWASQNKDVVSRIVQVAISPITGWAKLIGLFLGDNSTGPIGTHKGSQSQSGKIGKSGGNLLDYIDRKFGLPAGTMDKIYSLESNRGKSLISPKGATGPFGIMPSTAKEYGLSKEDTFDLNKSGNAMGKKIAGLIKYYKGDVQKAIMAYNWGEGNLDKYGVSGAPKETRDYWSKFSGAGVNGQTASVINNRNETTVNIGTITTQARDAASLTNGLRDQLNKNSLIMNNSMAVQ